MEKKFLRRGLRIKPEKTELCCVKGETNSVWLGGVEVSQKEAPKLLGYHLNKLLSPREHIYSLSSKITGLMRKIFKFGSYLSKRHLTIAGDRFDRWFWKLRGRKTTTSSYRNSPLNPVVFTIWLLQILSLLELFRPTFCQISFWNFNLNSNFFRLFRFLNFRKKSLPFKPHHFATSPIGISTWTAISSVSSDSSTSE